MSRRSRPDVLVRRLEEGDLDAADRIMRLAFGTYLGLPDPLTFHGDADYVRTRWRTDPEAAFAAEVDGELVGSNFATNWGSVGFFGPLTVRPDFWDQGVAQRLLEPTVALFDRWRTRHTGLFTFADSPKHVGLYQRFGFWPRFLTCVMQQQVDATSSTEGWSRFSALGEAERQACLKSCRELTDAIYAGLDVGREIKAVADQQLGDTVLLWDGPRLVGLAVCHCGPGSEAGSGQCYVKFGAAQPGPGAEQVFDRLLDACGALARDQRLGHLVAGVNSCRHKAYRRMIERGFRSDFQGVTMHRPNEPGYDTADVYVIDDWR